jgi:ribosomal protein S18 acetylase RimI-like enzyme
MGPAPPTIRPARPEDAAFIARNILSSQRGPRPHGWFDIALGWDEPRCLAFVERIAIARQKSWWHVSQFIVAEVDGNPAASLCATSATGIGPAAWAAIAEVANETGLSEAELAAILQRGAYSANCWVQGGEGDWLIEHVATLPAYRGRGLVSGLIDHALAAGKAAGFERASISFLIGNEPAERSYAKAGFAFAEEKRDPAFEAIVGAPGFRRFARAI